MTGIVILAMAALFIGLRLYSVLGRRTGHETSVPLVDELKPAKPITLEVGGQQSSNQSAPLFDTEIAAGLKSIAGIDSKFDPVRFVDGARSAYRMILEAFWRGDEVELKGLVADDVHSSFVEAIAARTTNGHVLDNRLINIEKTMITKAWVESKTAFIMIEFVADIAAVTRDSDGKVIAGSMTDAVPTTDVWTFSRQVRADTPEWTLVETDESA